MWSTTLKEKVISSGGTLVIRPDSGDPVEVLPKMFRILGENFGTTNNDKGYVVLNHVKVIWGDGINYQSISAILRVMVDLHGYSADNFAFGMGGALLGAPQRDDNKWAMKCSAIVLEGEHGVVETRDVFKDPITDPGKRSKAGFLKLVKNEVGEYKTIRDEENLVGFESVMDEVYRDGVLLRDQTIEQIRFNSNL
jgi:nicotinamide phosphoribosyltransferase